MAFCTFSKDLDNGYTIVDNKFITKYLPEADGFAVKVYLYGLYLCENRESDFSITAMSEVLKTTESKIMEAFAFWEDYRSMPQGQEAAQIIRSSMTER